MCVCGVYVCVCVCVVYTVVQFSFFIKPSFRCFFLASNTKPPTFVLPKTCTNWSETFDFVDPTADTIDLYLPSIYRVMADTESCCCRCIGVEADFISLILSSSLFCVPKRGTADAEIKASPLLLTQTRQRVSLLHLE